MTIAQLTTPNNIEICYEIFGDKPNAQPIVFISGAGLQMLGWPPLTELIGQHVERASSSSIHANRNNIPNASQRREQSCLRE